MSKFSCFSQKGLSLYLAIIIMSIILAIVLGTTTILTGQIKTMRGIENSVIAFYGADTGIERELKEDNATGTETIDSMGLGGVEYIVKKIGPGGECSATNYCIESEGTYKQTKRAIRITR